MFHLAAEYRCRVSATTSWEQKLIHVIILFTTVADYDKLRRTTEGGEDYLYYLYRYVCGPKKLNHTLVIDSVRGRPSCRIYRLALPLLSPEMLSSSTKSRIFLYNAHLALPDG